MTSSVAITEKEAQELQLQGTALEEKAQAIQVKDTASYEAAGTFLVQIKEKRKEITAKPLEEKVKAHSVWSFLNDVCKMVQAPFDNAEKIIDRKMIDYRAEVEAKRQREQRVAEEKARKEAEDIRKKEIAEAKKLGDKEGARNLAQAPIIPQPVAPRTAEPPKIKGLPVRKVWDFQINDQNKIPRKYWTLDLVAIRKVVNALGDKHGIPGVSAFQKEVQ